MNNNLVLGFVCLGLIICSNASAAAQMSEGKSTKTLSAVEDEKLHHQTHEDIVKIMHEDLDKSESVLKNAKTLSEKMDYALFLHAFREQSKERDAIIASILSEIKVAIFNYPEHARYNGHSSDDEGSFSPYNGSDNSLILYMVYGSLTGAVRNSFQFYEIPCSILQKRPDLLAATGTKTSLPDSNDRYFPVSGCDWGRGKVLDFPDNITGDYIATTKKAGTKYFANLPKLQHMGWRYDLFSSGKIKPFYKGEVRDWVKGFSYPYETWAYLSHDNMDIFQNIKKNYDSAYNALIHYYITKFSLTESEAAYSAKYWLFSASRGADCGGPLAKTTLRQLVMDGASLETIKQFVEAGKHKESERLQSLNWCSRNARIDPLMHIAVMDSDILKYLWRLKQEMNLSEQEEWRLDLRLSIEVNNSFKKTPLMVAAQYNWLKSAQFLIEQGAMVNVVTDSRNNLSHDNRTPLMYAAGYSSLDMIKLLLQSGAKPDMRDTKGLLALDYLEGRGPVPANEVMSDADREKARQLMRVK